MTVLIYHNPRCSKSRQTLSLIQERGYSPQIIEYLNTPLGITEISRILSLLQMEPRELFRKKETKYKELNLSDPNLTRDQLIEAMVKNPILIERPIVVVGNKAVIGRPPEEALTIL